MLKKFSVFFSLLVLISFSFAQEKKLEDYLEEIKTIVSEEKTLDEDFQRNYDETMEGLRSSAKERMDEVPNQEPRPWENPYEYSERLNREILAIREELEANIEAKDSELKAAYKTSKNEFASKKIQAWIDFKKQDFYYAGTDNLNVVFSQFDVYEKCWPFVVESKDDFLVYTSNTFNYYANVLDIENEYTTMQELIDENQVTAEMLVKVRQDNEIVDAYEIYVVYIILRDLNGNTLREFPCDNEVIMVGKTSSDSEPTAFVSSRSNNNVADDTIPLIAAVRRNKKADVEKLLKEGADVNVKDENGDTPIIIAARNGNAQIFEMLLRYGADPFVADAEGKTAAEIAATSSKQALVTTMGTYSENKKALQEGVASGDSATVEKLLNEGLSVNYTDGDGNTPLLVATKRNDLSMVQTLLQHGANVNAVDSEGSSPLVIAAKNGYTQVASELIANKADVNLTDSSKKTPLIYAIENEKNDVIVLLAKNGADLEVKDNNGKTPLIIAAGTGNKELVKTLLENNADISAKDKNGNNALHNAAEQGKMDVIYTLVEAGVNASAKNNAGQTPATVAAASTLWPGGKSDINVAKKYLTAAAKSYDKLVKLAKGKKDASSKMAALIDAGTSPNASDADYKTALMWATEMGVQENIDYLLSKGANPNLKDASGKTAADYKK